MSLGELKGENTYQGVRRHVKYQETLLIMAVLLGLIMVLVTKIMMSMEIRGGLWKPEQWPSRCWFPVSLYDPFGRR